MSALKISTKKSLYKPIEVDIDGTIFQAAKFDRALFLELKKSEEAAKAGDVEALFTQVKNLFPELTDKILNQIDLRDIKDIIDHCIDQIMQPTKDMTEDEKKASKPGPPKS